MAGGSIERRKLLFEYQSLRKGVVRNNQLRTGADKGIPTV